MEVLEHDLVDAGWLLSSPVNNLRNYKYLLINSYDAQEKMSKCCTLKLPNLEHKLAYIRLCRKKIFLCAKMINYQNYVVFQRVYKVFQFMSLVQS